VTTKKIFYKKTIKIYASRRQKQWILWPKTRLCLSLKWTLDDIFDIQFYLEPELVWISRIFTRHKYLNRHLLLSVTKEFFLYPLLPYLLNMACTFKQNFSLAGLYSTWAIPLLLVKICCRCYSLRFKSC
jgi:hypothetical protein